MSLTRKLSALVASIAEKADLTPQQVAAFQKLVEAHEESLTTSAAIEPDDDYEENDDELLPVLDGQEDTYRALYRQADPAVKVAFGDYLDARKENMN